MLDVIDIITVVSAIGNGHVRGSQLSTNDLALGVELHLIPAILLHLALATLCTDVGEGIANLGQHGLFTVVDDLAGPGPLVGSLVIGLGSQLVAVDIDQVLAGLAILANHDGSDDVAVILVQDISAGRSNVGSLIIGIALLHSVEILPQVDAGVLHAGGDIVNAGDDNGILSSFRVDQLQLGRQIDGGIVAVDARITIATLQSNVLLVDGGGGDVVRLSDLGLARNLVSNRGQGVHAVLISGVGEPGIDQSEIALLVSNVIHDISDIALVALEGDGLGGAVGEDGGGIVVLLGQVGAAGVNAGDEDIVVLSVNLLNTNQVAIGIQNDIVGGVLHVALAVVVQNFHIVLGGSSILILGAAGGHVAAQLEAGDLGIGNGLSFLNGLDLMLSNGNQIEAVFLDALNVDIIVGDGDGLLVLASSQSLLVLLVVGAVDFLQGIHGEVSRLLLGVIILLGLGQVGVDDSDVDLFVVGILEDLSQNAGVGAANGLLVVLVDAGLVEDVGIDLAVGDTVDGDIEVIILNNGLAQQVVQIGAGNLNTLVLLNQQVVADISADFLLVVGPSGDGTLKVVGLILGGQLVEILLGELDLAVLLNVAVGSVVAGPRQILSGLVGGDIAIIDNDGLSGVLNHGGLQGVEGIQAGLFTSDSLDTVEIALQVLVQADVDGLLGDVDGPVGASVALVGGLIAQSTQQHLHKSIAGQGVGGTESAVSVTGDDAGLLAVSNVASKGVVGRNVLVRSSISHQGGCSGGAKDQVADDLGSSATGQGGGGIEGTVGITVDDLHGGHHGNSFVISNLAVVGEVLGTSRDGDQRHGHHQSQYQRKELLHGVSSLIKCRNIPLDLPAPGSGFRVGASRTRNVP